MTLLDTLDKNYPERRCPLSRFITHHSPHPRVIIVDLSQVRLSNSDLVCRHSLVAAFVGATQGIGEAALRSLVAAQASQATVATRLRVYVVGRSKETTATLIADCLLRYPAAEFHFVRAQDLSLLTDVDRVCTEITALERERRHDRARIDLLCMSRGHLSFAPRRDTKEGLEFRMSLCYYSRMRFIVNLLPLLTASELPTHVISVFAAGKEGDLDPDDLSLRHHFGIISMRSHVTYMTTLFFEHLVARNPGKLALVHVFPGLIITDGSNSPSLSLWFRLLWQLLGPLVRWWTTPLAECGERILSLAAPTRYPAAPAVGPAGPAPAHKSSALGPPVATSTDGVVGGGSYAVNLDGETVRRADAYLKWRLEGMGAKIVAHTVEAFDVIRSGEAFAG